jgi:hypothetical protein
MAYLVSWDIILHQPDGGSKDLACFFFFVYVDEFEGPEGIFIFIYMKAATSSQANNRPNLICCFRSSFVSQQVNFAVILGYLVCVRCTMGWSNSSATFYTLLEVLHFKKHTRLHFEHVIFVYRR